MKLTGFELRIIEIPMRFAVQHSLAERTVARNVLVAARDEEGRVGWGECCPRSYVTGETIESVQEALAGSLLPPWVGRELAEFEDVVAILEDLLGGLGPRQQAAFCACELAVLDLAGKRFGRSAGSVLGPVLTPEVRYSGVIASEAPDRVRRFAEFMRAFEVQAVKLKVVESLERNLENARIARDVLGGEVSLRVDANCAWDAAEAIRQLEALAAFDIVGCEQPLPADDLDGLAEVTAAGIAPIVVDESMCTLEDARLLIERRACDVFNVRISKCGGLLNSGRIHRLAQEAGLRCQMGAQVGETGILSAAGRHYATRCAPLLWLEGSYGELLLERDIVEPSVAVGKGGLAPALDEPGLGVVPMPDVLEEVTVDRRSLGGTSS